MLLAAFSSLFRAARTVGIVSGMGVAAILAGLTLRPATIRWSSLVVRNMAKIRRKGILLGLANRNCHENRMAGCRLMHPAHTADTRADLIFIHNGAPQALVGCYENRMAGCCLMHHAHIADIRTGLIFIHNGAPQALVGSQAAQRRASSTTPRVVPLSRFARATRGRRGRVSAGYEDGGGGVGRRSDALAVTIARNTCRKTLKTLIQRPGPLARHDPGSSPSRSRP